MYKRLRIGDGSVRNLINFVKSTHITGGLMKYTLSRGYFLNNISNNFDEGRIGRYGYGEGGTNEAIEKIEGTDGKLLGDGGLVPATLEQDRIGDYYSTNYRPNNPEMGFYTLEEFSALGNELRKLNIKENVKEGTFEARYGEDSADKFIVKNVLKSNIGDENVSVMNGVVYNTLFGKREPLYEASMGYRELNKAYDSHVKSSTGYFDDGNRGGDLVMKFEVTTPVRKQNYVLPADKKVIESEVFGTEFDKNILSTAEKIRNKYSAWNIENPMVKLLFKDKGHYKYGDSYSANEVKVKETGKNEYKFLNGQKKKLDASGLLGLYIDLWEDNMKNKSGYGIKLDPFAPYSINEKRYSPKNHIIDSSIKGGNLRVTNPNSPKNATYSYYNEATYGEGGNGNILNTSDGFVSTIDSFSNASMMLRRTNELFKNNEIKSLVNRFHTDNKTNFQEDFLVSSYGPDGLSRGRNLRRASAADNNTGFDNPYCRVWTTRHQYAKMKDRIRPFMDGESFKSVRDVQAQLGETMRPNQGAERLGNYSVLQDNGFVKISPYNENGKLLGGRKGLKKYMFSIENLAWKGFTTNNLSPEQTGPFGGRIMWFPPYNLKFSENINTEWNTNEFIGRGERIYTYKNTDRAGTLSFTLLIDHPAILNKWKGMGDVDYDDAAEQELLRYFAGCGELNVATESNSDLEKEDSIEKDNNPDTTPELDPNEQYFEYKYLIFFPNDFSAKKYYSDISQAVETMDNYEMDNSADAFEERDKAYENEILQPGNEKNYSKYNLNNGGWRNNDNIADLIDTLLGIKINSVGMEVKSYAELKNLAKDISSGGTIFGYDPKQYEISEIVTQGFASDDGYPENNAILSKDRAETIKRFAKYFCETLDESKFREGECKTVGNKTGDVNVLSSKIARSAVITFKVKLRDDVAPENLLDDGATDAETVYGGEIEASVVTAERNIFTSTETHDEKHEWTYQNEYMYFKMLKSSDNFIYKNIVNKVKFFEPAFHSLTPEGFNARLNFLQQCTRQGPTVNSVNGGQKETDELYNSEKKEESKFKERARNLAFGAAPYCILRIGDFFYSKIVIDSISIDYDTGNGIQWDLNPEGVGVQPMFANVNMNFHFIGGQDIDGPVAQLQNAISYNYYANSSIYTPSTQKSIPTVPPDDNEEE